MPVTSVLSLPYPAASDPADVPTDMAELANAIVTGMAGIGTSLPVSPFDGQEYTLVDSATAPTWAWRFRYVAGITGTYKWIFVGGPPLATFESVSQGITVGSGFAGLGPALTLPRAGAYIVQHTGSVYAPSGGAVLQTRWQTYPGAVAISGGVVVDSAITSANSVVHTDNRQRLTVTTATAILCGQQALTNAVQSSNRFSSAIPVAVA